MRDEGLDTFVTCHSSLATGHSQLLSRSNIRTALIPLHQILFGDTGKLTGDGPECVALFDGVGAGLRGTG